MTLIDTSAWVEFLRGTDSAVCNRVDTLLGTDHSTTDPIVMEVLAGARDARHLRDLRSLVGRAQLIRCNSADFLAASAIHRECRRTGETVRRLIDCLIAAVAIRHDVPLLHLDSDFHTIARNTRLRVVPA